MVERVWVVDDGPSAHFPIWTRGTVGDIVGGVVSPLTWSMLGGEAERAWRDALRKFGAVRERDFAGDFPANLAVFGGYCYLNVSAARLLAKRTPGFTVEQVDTAFLGGSQAPPYDPARGDRRRVVALRTRRSIARIMRTTELPALAADREAVDWWRARQARAASGTDEQLRATIEEFRSRFRPLFTRVILASLQVTVPLNALTRICCEQVGDSTMLVRLLAGLGDAEWAEANRQLWRFGRTAAADPRLDAAFEAGPLGLADRLGTTQAGAALLAQIAGFQADHGARGPREWDPSAPVRGTDLDLVLAEVNVCRQRPETQNPDVLAARQAADRDDAAREIRDQLRPSEQWRFDRALRAMAVFLPGRERAKGTALNAVHGFRLAAQELARRAAARSGRADPEAMWLVTIDELDDYLANPQGFRWVLAARAALRAHLSELEPPFVFVGTQPAPSTWERRTEPATSVSEQ